MSDLHEQCSLGEMAYLHKEQVSPSGINEEKVFLYSFPSYDSLGGPALEKSNNIKSSKFLIPKNAVLLSKLNPKYPKVWRVDPVKADKAVSSTEFLVLTPNKGVDRDFLFYCLNYSKTQAAMEKLVTGTSSSHQRVKPQDALSIELPCPEESEQKAISSVLKSLDDKIETNRRMNETLEEMARAIFQSWFVDFDPVRAKMEGRQPEGMDAEMAALFPDRLVEDPEFGEIPEGWGVSSIGKEFNLTMGQSPPGHTYNEEGEGIHHRTEISDIESMTLKKAVKELEVD